MPFTPRCKHPSHFSGRPRALQLCKLVRRGVAPLFRGAVRMCWMKVAHAPLCGPRSEESGHDLGSPGFFCAWFMGRSTSGRQLTGQRTFDPERFLRWGSVAKVALGSQGCGPCLNSNFQTESFSLSEIEFECFLCACWLRWGRSVRPPPAQPCLPRVSRAPRATSCGLGMQVYAAPRGWPVCVECPCLI